MGALEGLCVGAMEGGGKGLVGGWLEELIRVIGDPETGEVRTPARSERDEMRIRQ